MRFKVTSALNLEDLKTKIENECPSWNCKFRSPKILIVNERGSSAAAMVMVRKEKAIVNEGFTTLGGQLLFVISILALGILIPIIIYFIAFFPKQKAIRDKVGAFIKDNYGDNEVR